MVKPAMPYLDIISDARTLAPHHPLACYQVRLAFLFDNPCSELTFYARSRVNSR